MTPGVTALEYALRRSRLASKLPEGAVAILAASEVKYRAPGIFHEYRQESNFFYLTGRLTDIYLATETLADHTILNLDRFQRTERTGSHRERRVWRQPYFPSLRPGKGS